MDSDNIDTQRNQILTDKLMMKAKNLEEYNDIFKNQSSSVGFFSMNRNQNKKRQSTLRSSNLDDEQIINMPLSSIPLDTEVENLSAPLRFHRQHLPVPGELIQSRQAQLTYRPRNIYQNLIQYFYLKTFMKKLLKKKNFNSQFNQYHFNVINDKGSVYDKKSYKEKTIYQRKEGTEKIQLRQIVIRPISRWIFHTYIKTNQMFDRIPIFYPESMSKLIWDGFAQIARVYFIYMIPFDLSFNQQQFMFGIQYSTTVIMIMVLLFDFLVSLNTAHYKYGQIVINRLQIAKHVIAKSGGLEIMSLGVIVLIWGITECQQDYQIDASTQLYQLGLMIFFVQYRNISKFIRQLEEALNFSKPTKAILELMKLITLVIVVLHVFSCLWYWVSRLYSHKTLRKSWLDQRGLTNESWQEDYLYSFYFSTVTMFTVGYGDITPQSDLETIISIFFMMITSIQLSYSVSTVGAIIDKITINEEENFKKLQTINTFMQTKKIGYQLQYQQNQIYIVSRVREYLNYYWQAQNQEDGQSEKIIISQLSENLRERLMLEANSQILNNSVFFRDHFSDQLKIQLVKCIKQAVVQPENEIDFGTLFPENKKDQIYVCFIEKGSIEIHIEKETNYKNYSMNRDFTAVSQVNEGQSLGIVSFLTGEKSRERFRSLGFTKLLLLSRDDFLNIIIEFPKDYEQYQKFQDQMKLYQHFKFLQMECFSCKSIDHKALDCPLLHFIPDREFLIKQYQFSRNQERNESTKRQQIYKRKIKKDTIIARFDQKYISESAVLYQNDHWQETMYFDFDEEQSHQGKFSEKSFQEGEQEIQGSLQEMNQGMIFAKQKAIIQYKSINHQPRQKIQDLSFSTSVNDLDTANKKMLKNTNKYVQNSRDIIPNIQRQSPSLSFFNAMSKNDVIEHNNHDKIICINIQSKNYPPGDLLQEQIQTLGVNSTKSLKNKFLKVIHKIKSVNSLNKKNLKQKLINDRVNRLAFEKNMLTNLTLRGKILIQNLSIFNGNAVFQRDSKIAEFTILQLQMLKEFKSPINEFEQAKAFKFYFPNNNIEQVLNKQESYYRPNQQNTKNLNQIYSCLVQYLMYPYEYIDKFVFYEQPILNRAIQPNIIISSQKRIQSRKSVKFSRINQIHPSNEEAILI